MLFFHFVIRKDSTSEQISLAGTIGNLIFVIGSLVILYIAVAVYPRLPRPIAEGAYKNIFDNALEGIFQATTEGRFVNVNPAMARIFGYDSPEDMVGSIGSIAHQFFADQADQKRMVAELQEHGIVENFELQTLRKDGSVIWTKVNARAVPDRSGQILYYEGFVQDITSRVQRDEKIKLAEQTLRETEARYRSLVENIPAIVFINDADNPEKTIYVNPKVEEILGYTPEEWKDNLRWAESIHPEDRPGVLAEDERTTRSGEPFRMEYRLRAKDGRYVWIKEDSTLNRDQNGKPLFWQGIMFDLTNRKRTEQTLHAVLKGTSRTTGTEFFRNLVTELQNLLDADLVFVGRTKGHNMVETLAVCQGGEIAQNFEYDLDGTPCQTVIGKEPCIYNGDVQEKFPKDTALVKMGMRSYMGVPLYTADGKSIGIIVAMHHKKWDETFLTFSVISTFAERASTEMERLEIEENLRRRENILNAVSLAADTFLRESWEENVNYFLMLLGKAARVSRAYVFLRQSQDEHVFHMPYEWCAPGISTQIDNPNLNGINFRTDGFERWIPIMEKNEIVQGLVRDLPASEQVELRAENILSIICVPITVNNNWWGFIGLDDCVDERKWDFTEIDTLKTAANILSAAIQREKSEDEIWRQLQELTLLHAAALAGTTATDQDALIGKVTMVIGTTLYPDNCGILLLDDEGLLIPHPSYHGIPDEMRRLKLRLDQGITGQVASTGVPVSLGDVSRYPNYVPVTDGIKSELCVPIKINDKIIGVFNVESKSLNAFTQADERLLSTLAGQLATSIERVRLFEIERKQRQQAETLREATTAITSSLELRLLLETILEMLGKIISFDSASVILEREDTHQIVAGKGLPEGFAWIGQTFDDLHKWSELTTTHSPLVIANAQADPRFVKTPGTEYIRGWMALPLVVRDEVIGYISVDNREVGAYSEKDAAIAQTFVNQASTAIENARLFESEQRRRREAETLREAAAIVAATLDWEDAINLILDAMMRVVPYDSASIMLLGDGFLEIVGGRGWANKEDVLGLRFPVPGDNPNTEVIEHKKTLILGDARKKYPPFNRPPHDHIHSWMGVPLLVRGEVIGMIAVDSKQDNYFKPEDAQLALAFTHHAALAIENTRLYNAEQQKRHEAETLRQAVESVSSSLDIDQVLDNVLKSINAVVPYDSASVLLQEGSLLRMAATRGFSNPDLLANATFPADDQLYREIIAQKQPVILPDAQKDPRFHDWGKSEDIHGWMGIPLIVRGEPIGCITLDSHKPGVYDESQGALAQTFARHAEMAIENARLYQDAVLSAERSDVLHRVSQEVIKAIQVLDHTYTAIHEAASKLMDCDAFVITLRDEARQENHAVYLAEGGQIFPPRRVPADQGLSGQIIKSGKAVILNNLKTDPPPNVIHFGDERVVQSALAVPMIIGERVIGMISAQSYRTPAYGPEEQRVLEMLASYAAAVVENSRLFTETRRRLYELEVVNRVSVNLRMAQNLEAMLPIILNEALIVMSTDVGAIWLYDPISGQLNMATARGWLHPLSTYTIKPGEDISGYVFQTGEPYFTGEFRDDRHITQFNQELIPSGWSGLCVPIRTSLNIIGAICVAGKHPRNFSKNDSNLLTTLSEMAGNAIQRASLHSKTELQVQRLMALRDVDTAISSSMDIRITLDLLVEHLINQLKVDAVAAAIFNPDLQQLAYTAGRGFRSVPIGRVSLPLNNSLGGRVVLARQSLKLLNATGELGLLTTQLPFATEGFLAYIGLPLIAKGQVKGVIEVFHRHELNPDEEWLDFLHTMAGQAAIAIDNAQLLENLQRSNQELAMAYDSTLEGWGRALELRDKETQGHTRRVTDLTVRLARLIGVPDQELVHIRRGVLLHDIGKMGIPDNILNKPGELTEEEWEIMRQHPRYAHDLITPISYLRSAEDIPYCHHEKWDGSGYPRGLKGYDIPLAARIFAVIDVWDALTSDRPYRGAWSREQAIQYLRDESGKHFDPVIVEQFLKMISGKE
ncbi:MAG: GAF domain-containing protein [Chloroflexota bacterium]